MKNQYFGDKRDYFKYGLLEALATGVNGIEQLSCIWMLTPPVANNDGRKAFVPVPEHARLSAFFYTCRAKGIADVSEMKAYFGNQAFRFFSYRDGTDGYMTLRSRSDYFRDVPDVALRKSIVFFDPDNGLEPVGKATIAHLRYEELANVFARMDNSSVAVIYQHLPRMKASRFWPSIASALRQRLGRPVAYVADSDLAFFVIPRNDRRMSIALSILKKQAHIVPQGRPSRQVACAD
jgi:hypothetical protein